MQFTMSLQQRVNLMAAEGNVNDVKRFYRKHRVSPNWRGANLAARAGKVAMLRYLNAHHTRATSQGVVWAAEKGYLKVVKLLGQFGVDLTGAANAALSTGNTGIVVMLHTQFGVSPTRQGVDMAFLNNHTDALNFAATRLNLYTHLTHPQDNIVFCKY